MGSTHCVLAPMPRTWHTVFPLLFTITLHGSYLIILLQKRKLRPGKVQSHNLSKVTFLNFVMQASPELSARLVLLTEYSIASVFWVFMIVQLYHKGGLYYACKTWPKANSWNWLHKRYHLHVSVEEELKLPSCKSWKKKTTCSLWNRKHEAWCGTRQRST